MNSISIHPFSVSAHHSWVVFCLEKETKVCLLVYLIVTSLITLEMSQTISSYPQKRFITYYCLVFNPLLAHVSDYHLNQRPF